MGLGSASFTTPEFQSVKTIFFCLTLRYEAFYLAHGQLVHSASQKASSLVLGKKS